MVLLPIMILLLNLSSVFCQDQLDANKYITKKETKNKSTIISKTYKLKGLKQSCCLGIVTYSLKEVKGFIRAESNLKQQKILVWYDSKKCKEEAIKKAINKTPYPIED